MNWISKIFQANKCLSEHDRILELVKRLPDIESLSNCMHRHVGSILYNPKTSMIIGIGVNKTPSTESPCVNSNSCTKHLTGKCPIIHSEVDAILHAHCDLKGMYLICTYSPCYECSKVINAVGIKRVYYCNVHHRTDWKYLKDNNIEAIYVRSEE